MLLGWKETSKNGKGQANHSRRMCKRGRPRRTKSAPAVLLSDMTNKCKRWTDALMRLAIQAVEDGSSVSQAAHAHGVSYTTLYDRMVGNACHGTNPGPRPYLTTCEENDLSAFLVEVAKAGMGKIGNKLKRLLPKLFVIKLL